MALGAVPGNTFVFNDKPGKVLDTDAKEFDLSTIVMHGTGTYTYTAVSSDATMVDASVTEAGMLSVSLVPGEARGANFPYSAFTVNVTVDDGIGMAKKGITVRRNKKPTGMKVDGDDEDGVQTIRVTVGTQHPNAEEVVPTSVTGGFSDDDKADLTFDGVANISGNASFVMITKGKAGKFMVKGLKSTETGAGTDGDRDTADDVDVPIAIDVTATDTGGLSHIVPIAFEVSVNQAPKLSTAGTLRDVAIRLSETASSPLRFVLVEGHFMDPEEEDLDYTFSLSNNYITVVGVCLEEDTGAGDGTGVYTLADTARSAAGECADGDLEGAQINPLKAGETIVTVTATEQDNATTTEVVEGFMQTVAATFTVTVLPE
ncbi:MAG: hypothetical protein OXQ89_21900 [Rhodospirillaceae bacterium]|nr:hypothetical protein [Rhodospirillaceae bacterium]MDE0360750.1 hypothetical protein [Rhodospirillaceae bacterium]